MYFETPDGQKQEEEEDGEVDTKSKMKWSYARGRKWTRPWPRALNILPLDDTGYSTNIPNKKILTSELNTIKKRH